MIDSTAINQRNVLTGVIVVALLAICAISLLVMVNRSSSETEKAAPLRAGPRRSEKRRDNRYRQRDLHRQCDCARWH